MEKKNMKEWMGKVMSDTTRIAIPIMTHPGIELSGRKGIDAVTDGDEVSCNKSLASSLSAVNLKCQYRHYGPDGGSRGFRCGSGLSGG